MRKATLRGKGKPQSVVRGPGCIVSVLITRASGDTERTEVAAYDKLPEAYELRDRLVKAGKEVAV